jgi:hypothetical protein
MNTAFCHDTNMVDICDRCANIPWNWEKPKPYEISQLCTINETSEELLDSDCRICQIFGRLSSASLRGIHPMVASINHYGHIELTCNDVKIYHSGLGVNGPSLKYYDDVLEDDFRAWDLDRRNKWKFVNMNSVRSWTRECKEGHEECTPTRHSFFFSFKLIDCVHRKVVLAAQPCEYVALSYVWGAAYGHDHPTSNFDSGKIPHTIEDSMEVTRQLGYRYLWVDRYVSMDPKHRSGMKLTSNVVH